MDSFEDSMASNRVSGLTYRVKSFMNQLTFRMNGSFGTTTNSVFPGNISRHVRVMYIVTKDEPIESPSDLFSALLQISGRYYLSSGSIYPMFV